MAGCFSAMVRANGEGNGLAGGGDAKTKDCHVPCHSHKPPSTVVSLRHEGLERQGSSIRTIDTIC